MLAEVNRYLLWMVRTIEGQPPRQTPSRLAEAEITREALERYSAATAPVDSALLASAYIQAWSWGREIWVNLGMGHDFEIPTPLLEMIDARTRIDP
jgi:hypothetical protein